jgi:glyoxylase-like metal-dependent hydrolase (beta-lactamase superfamily II)
MSPQTQPASFQRSSRLTRYLLAPNPGPMSLDGTNSYLLADPSPVASGGRVVVVDPGPLDEGHLTALAAAGTVELVLITHWHPDHTAASEWFHRMTGAPVRALDPAYCHGGPALRGGEEIQAAGVRLQVLATPGHTADSVCFHLPDDGPAPSDDGPARSGTGNGSVLTGDTILGRGTTIIDYPDGRLGPYLASLERLRALGPATVLPAHGPVLPDLAAICGAYAAHRSERLDQIRAALAQLGQDAPVEAVTDVVYADVDPSVRRAAEKSVAAQLDYLRG